MSATPTLMSPPAGPMMRALASGWRLSGIFREVRLLSRPTGGLEDVFVHATAVEAAGMRALNEELGFVPVESELLLHKQRQKAAT